MIKKVKALEHNIGISLRASFETGSFFNGSYETGNLILLNGKDTGFPKDPGHFQNSRVLKLALK